jgi:hypothetical protein
MIETSRLVNHSCETVVGELFDDQVSQTTLTRSSPGGNGMHRREAWYCQGESGNYYVKLFEATDTGFSPEAAFFTRYGSKLDFVIDGQVYRDLDDETFTNAIVTKQVSGKSLDNLLQQIDDPHSRHRLSVIGAVSLSKLHTIEVDGFGLLTEGQPAAYPTWSDYLQSAVEYMAEHQGMLLEAGLNEYEIATIADEVQQSGNSSVTPVLCHGDPKPAHVIVQGERTGILLDFGRAQGNIAFRDCLQYGSVDPTYFDANALVETITDDRDTDLLGRRAACLIRLTSLLMYSVRVRDPRHCSVLSEVIRGILARDDLPNRYSSVADFYDHKS